MLTILQKVFLVFIYFLQPELIESIEEYKKGRDVFPKLPADIDVSALKI